MMSSSQRKQPPLRKFTLKVGWRAATTPAVTPAVTPEAASVNATQVSPQHPKISAPAAEKKQHTQPRVNWLLAGISAAIVVTIALAITPRLFPIQKPSAVAKVTQVQGDFYRNKNISHTAVTLYPGDTLATEEDSQVYIHLNNATHITLGANTKLTLHEHHLQIHSGRAYISAAEAGAGITVKTPFAEITDIGTQYEVRITPSALHVTMREGTTKINSPNGIIYASTSGGLGDVISLDHTGNTQNHHMAKSDEYWEWTLNTTPDFNLYNASVDELLQWAASITGKDVIYASDKLQQQAKDIYLPGGNLSSKNISQDMPQILKGIPITVAEHKRAFTVDPLEDSGKG